MFVGPHYKIYERHRPKLLSARSLKPFGISKLS